MNRWLAWATTHRGIVAVIAAVYFVINVLAHDHVQAVALRIIDRLTIRGANLAVIVTAAAVALVAVPWLARQVGRGALARIKLAYGVLTIVLALSSGVLLFAVNSESVHFVQYGILAVLLLPLIRRAGETILVVTLLGALDEAWQYWVLHRNWGVYYDFNDVVLNLLGAAMGVLVVIVVADGGERPSGYGMRELLGSGAFRTATLLAVVGAGLLLTGRLAFDPTADGTEWAVLRRSGPQASFWARPDWGRAYHVLSPWEGFLGTVLLLALYVPLDRFADWLPCIGTERALPRREADRRVGSLDGSEGA